MPYLEEFEKVNYRITKKGKIKKVAIKYFLSEEESSSLIEHYLDTGQTVAGLIREKINTIINCV